ncbi:acyltransferase family protein [Agrococcus sp. SL85]|uniref:acyltransferase family protein n=1 Tax=Agrococcus sp. SL85 TaxID=2995141 RepID=UPI00226C77D5|nr:acyltransferase family protein [Agrococcus sp. SL85]WAC66378.1 acyltransferase family protein [Agrococcus sp. SL85]
MTTGADARLAQRDLTLDLARVSCVLLVVVIHLLFVGVGHGPDGQLLIERTVEAQPWFAAATWLGDVMPLFFVVGGFAAMAGWRSLERRGGDADAFVRLRLVRLARPALPLLAFLALALVGAALLGVDPLLVDTVAIGIGSPLWFLAAYVLAQALAPAMIRLHERAPLRTLALLALAACLVDAARLGTGIPQLGMVNVVVVWVAVQQLGFWMHDGWFRQRSPWALAGIVLAGYALLLVLVPFAGYSPSMLSNQYPPTVPMLVLGAIQAAALTLLHRPLAALMETRPARAVVWLAGSRLMTIYLWHLPIIMVLTGLQLLLPLPLPEPGSSVWWATRIPMLLAVLGVVWLLSLWLVRYERSPSHLADPVHPGRAATVAAVLLFAIAPFLIMELGLDALLAGIGVVGTTAAIWLVRGGRARLVAP